MQREIVHGLKYVQKTSRLAIPGNELFFFNRSYNFKLIPANLTDLSHTIVGRLHNRLYAIYAIKKSSWRCLILISVSISQILSLLCIITIVLCHVELYSGW